MTNETDYFVNWYTKNKLICQENDEYASVGAAYFLGFAAGVVLFPLPDLLGRKLTMTLAMLFFIPTIYL